MGKSITQNVYRFNREESIEMRKLSVWVLSLFLGSVSDVALSAAASGAGDSDQDHAASRRVPVAAAASSGVKSSESPEELAKQFIANYNVKTNKERVVRAFEDIKAGHTSFGKIIPGDLDRIATASHCLLKDGMDGGLMEVVIDCVFHASIDFAKGHDLSLITKRTSYIVTEDAMGSTINSALLVVASIPTEEFPERFSRAKKVLQAETNLGFLDPYQNHRMIELLELESEEEIYPENEIRRGLVKQQMEQNTRREEKHKLIVWRDASERKYWGRS